MKLTIEERELVRVVRQTSRLLKDRQRAAQVKEKGAADYVTQVDLAVQKELTDQLHLRWPQIPVLGEEGTGETIRKDRPMWILDPVDGTTNLVHDFRESTISLALWDGEKTVMGVVCNPFLNETYAATRNGGARRNGRRIFASKRKELAHSLALFGTSPYRKEWAEYIFAEARNLYCRCEDIRRGGSAAYDMCRVACGRADVYFEHDLKPWDYAAGELIIREAGGCCTGLHGETIPVTENADILCTNGRVHPEALKFFAEQPDWSDKK